MKKLYFLLIFLFLIGNIIAQPGVWTCLKFNNGNPPFFGIKSVPDSSNYPPPYGHMGWTDLQGNFWLYGGVRDIDTTWWTDLWKYSPSNNMWTWVHGYAIPNDTGSIGLMGVPDSTNRPGIWGYGSTWVDLNSDLWMLHKNGRLWKYDISLNMWTWMKGNSSNAVYGSQGVSSSNNTPGQRSQAATWIDNQGNLWLFGGSKTNQTYLNDLWKYNITTNEWTWIGGSNLTNQLGYYGIMGIPDSLNQPRSRSGQVCWTDANNNVWMFGGVSNQTSGSCYDYFNDLWMFNTSTNLWTWMGGVDTINSGGNYGQVCIPSINHLPSARGYSIGWRDSLNNLWLYGGIKVNQFCSGYLRNNDLWKLNLNTMEWTLMSGSNLYNQQTALNNIGLPSLLNQPGVIGVTAPWIFNNEFYFQNRNNTGNVLWKYTINQNGCQIDWNINGTTFFDFNNNCALDIDPKIRSLKVQLFDTSGTIQQQVYSDANGLYKFNSDTGTFTYSVDTSDVPLVVTCPISGYHTSTITYVDSIDFNKNFAIKCKPGFDIGVKNIERITGSFFPADYSTIRVRAGDLTRLYSNLCAATIAGSVIINITGPATFVSSLPGSLTPNITGNTLTYNINNFASVSFNTAFQFILQTNSNAQNGNLICINVTVTPTIGDNDITNNSLQHCFSVVNSSDPNSKEVSPIGYIKADQEWLTYTINFQNTGNAPAQNIYILDTLNNNLDFSSFQLLSYSHEPMFTTINNNVVKFDFPYIFLPDSTNDEPNSHGFVQYKIKLQPGLPIGTTILNTAYNFFDFNPPVATNTVQNIITSLNPTITPNNLILCPNESDTLWTQVYDSYQWFKDGNLIPGATQQFLLVDYFNDAGSQFIVEVDSAGVIAQSAPVLVDGWAFLPPFVIQEGNFTIGSMGEMIICPGDTAYLILGLPYDTNIQWTDNGVAIPGANDDTLIVTQAGLYNVSGSPSQCPNYVQSLFDDIQVVIAPPLTPTITPNNLILCPNESDTLFTQVFGSYQWYKDGNLIPGATNQYLVVDAFNDAGSQFSVEVTQGNCTGTSSQVLVDGWAFLPPVVISEGDFTIGPNGEMLVCPGDTAYLILGLPYDTNIQWTNNGTAIPGANDDTLVVTQSGMYHVSGATSVCPNFVQNLGVTIEVIVQGPPTPVISQLGSTIVTSPGPYNFQWFYNGNPVGTNTNTLPLLGGGTYYLIITDSLGCSAQSPPINVIGPGIIEMSSGMININYNSHTSTLQITRSNSTAETEIFVSDVLGRVIAYEKMSKGISEIEIKLNNIKPGIYFVNLSEGGSVKFFVE